MRPYGALLPALPPPPGPHQSAPACPPTRPPPGPPTYQRLHAGPERCQRGHKGLGQLAAVHVHINQEGVALHLGGARGAHIHRHIGSILCGVGMWCGVGVWCGQSVGMALCGLPFIHEVAFPSYTRWPSLLTHASAPAVGRAGNLMTVMDHLITVIQQFEVCP